MGDIPPPFVENFGKIIDFLPLPLVSWYPCCLFGKSDNAPTATSYRQGRGFENLGEISFLGSLHNINLVNAWHSCYINIKVS